jgi:hypothetical protein
MTSSMREILTGARGTWPDMDYIKSVCRIGEGALCCRYLTMRPDGWSCEKHTSLKSVLDARVAAGTFTARGDNCEGQR